MKVRYLENIGFICSIIGMLTILIVWWFFIDLLGIRYALYILGSGFAMLIGSAALQNYTKGWPTD